MLILSANTVKEFLTALLYDAFDATRYRTNVYDSDARSVPVAKTSPVAVSNKLYDADIEISCHVASPVRSRALYCVVGSLKLTVNVYFAVASRAPPNFALSVLRNSIPLIPRIGET